MNRWRRATVAELQREGILLVEDGNHGEYRPRPDEFEATGIAFIRAADLQDGQVVFDAASKINETARQRITKGVGRPGDILISHKGTVGKVAAVPLDAPPFVCSPQTTFWRTLNEQELNRTYLHAYLRSPAFHEQLRSRAGETDMAPYVSLTAQRQLFVVLPPIKAQRSIAEIIGAMDDRIDLNRRMSETLAEIVQVRFREMLAAAQDSCHFGSIYEVARVSYGAPYASSRFNTRAIGKPVIRIRDLATYAPGIWTDEIHPREVAVAPGDIVVGMDGEFRAHMWLGPESVLNQRLCKFEPKSHGDATFVRLSLTEPLNFVERTEVATTVIHLGKSDIDAFKIPIPAAKVRSSFATAINPLEKRILCNARESRTLTELRDLLLPRLLSGELSIRAAERVMEDAR